MTVCIALACQSKSGERRIVVCTDSRLDEISGSTDTANKFDALGGAWFSLMSGDDWLMARELSRFLRRRIRSGEIPTQREDMFSAIKQGTEEFGSSPFCNKSHRVDLIVGGFADGEPLLMYTGYDTEAYTILASDVAVIGSGTQKGLCISRMKLKNIAKMLPALAPKPRLPCCAQTEAPNIFQKDT